ncbi:hypothetical protein Emag_004850 [Eimeria magna]
MGISSYRKESKNSSSLRSALVTQILSQRPSEQRFRAKARFTRLKERGAPWEGPQARCFCQNLVALVERGRTTGARGDRVRQSPDSMRVNAAAATHAAAAAALAIVEAAHAAAAATPVATAATPAAASATAAGCSLKSELSLLSASLWCPSLAASARPATIDSSLFAACLEAPEELSIHCKEQVQPLLPHLQQQQQQQQGLTTQEVQHLLMRVEGCITRQQSLGRRLCFFDLRSRQAVAAAAAAAAATAAARVAEAAAANSETVLAAEAVDSAGSANDTEASGGLSPARGGLKGQPAQAPACPTPAAAPAAAAAAGGGVAVCCSVSSFEFGGLDVHRSVARRLRVGDAVEVVGVLERRGDPGSSENHRIDRDGGLTKSTLYEVQRDVGLKVVAIRACRPASPAEAAAVAAAAAAAAAAEQEGQPRFLLGKAQAAAATPVAAAAAQVATAATAAATDLSRICKFYLVAGTCRRACCPLLHERSGKLRRQYDLLKAQRQVLKVQQQLLTPTAEQQQHEQQLLPPQLRHCSPSRKPPSAGSCFSALTAQQQPQQQQQHQQHPLGVNHQQYRVPQRPQQQPLKEGSQEQQQQLECLPQQAEPPEEQQQLYQQQQHSWPLAQQPHAQQEEQQRQRPLRIYPGSLRGSVFADWLVSTYGAERLQRGSGVVEIAGGRGELAFELAVKHGIAITIIDPRAPCTAKSLAVQPLEARKEWAISSVAEGGALEGPLSVEQGPEGAPAKSAQSQSGDSSLMSGGLRVHQCPLRLTRRQAAWLLQHKGLRRREAEAFFVESVETIPALFNPDLIRKSAYVRDKLLRASAIVGLHPDEATGDILRTGLMVDALRRGKSSNSGRSKSSSSSSSSSTPGSTSDASCGRQALRKRQSPTETQALQIFPADDLGMHMQQQQQQEQQEAAEPLPQLALAIVPCCVFSEKFPERRVPLAAAEAAAVSPGAAAAAAAVCTSPVTVSVAEAATTAAAAAAPAAPSCAAALGGSISERDEGQRRVTSPSFWSGDCSGASFMAGAEADGQVLVRTYEELLLWLHMQDAERRLRQQTLPLVGKNQVVFLPP